MLSAPGREPVRAWTDPWPCLLNRSPDLDPAKTDPDPDFTGAGSGKTGSGSGLSGSRSGTIRCWIRFGRSPKYNHENEMRSVIYRIQQIRQLPDLDPVYPDLNPDLQDLDPAKPDPDPVSAGSGPGSCRIQGSPWTIRSGSGSTTNRRPQVVTHDCRNSIVNEDPPRRPTHCVNLWHDKDPWVFWAMWQLQIWQENLTWGPNLSMIPPEYFTKHLPSNI